MIEYLKKNIFMFNISFFLVVYLIHYYFTLVIYIRTENFINRKKKLIKEIE